MGPSLSNSLFLWLEFTDLVLADEDTNSILTDNANGAIQGTWWPNLETMQVAPPDD